MTLSSPTQAVPTHHPSHPLGSPPTTSAAMTLASDVPTLGWFVGSSEMNTSGMGKMCFPLWRNVVDSMAASWRSRCETDEIGKFPGRYFDLQMHSLSMLRYSQSFGFADRYAYGDHPTYTWSWKGGQDQARPGVADCCCFRRQVWLRRPVVSETWY